MLELRFQNYSLQSLLPKGFIPIDSNLAFAAQIPMWQDISRSDRFSGFILKIWLK